MKIFHFFYRYNKRFCVVFVLLTIINGLLSGAVIALINSLMSDLINADGTAGINVSQDLMLFTGLVLGNLLLDRELSVAATKFTVRMVHNVRMQIIQKIKKIEYRNFEKIGEEHIFTILIRDTTVISNGAYLVVRFFSSIITILVCLVYMFWIFPLGFFMTCGIVAIGLGIFLLRQKKIMKDLTKSRELESVFFSQIQDLIGGFKELKLSTAKREDIYSNYILKASNEARSLRAKSLIKYTNNNLLGSFFFYLFAGVILFYFPSIIGDNGKIYTFLLLVIYIIGPVASIADMIPSMSNINIAIDQVEKLEVDVMTINDEKGGDLKQEEVKKIAFETIEFKNVYFSYAEDDSDEEAFTIGPIDIHIDQGKSHLIYGRNGEGKTTFIKVLTGLYKPISGEILVDGEKLKSEDYESFRNMFSVIYSDFHLFENLYGVKDYNEERIQELLCMMKIDQKVNFVDGRFSTYNLSTGQRKRMALVLAILEDKPILVLDEWAAEQDPEFRKFFYTQIIPDLERNNKTIIMISHDEQYFEVANSIFRLNEGQIKRTSKEELHFSLN